MKVNDAYAVLREFHQNSRRDRALPVLDGVAQQVGINIADLRPGLMGRDQAIITQAFTPIGVALLDAASEAETERSPADAALRALTLFTRWTLHPTGGWVATH